VRLAKNSIIHPPVEVVLIGTDPEVSLWLKDRSSGAIGASFDVSMLCKMNNAVVRKRDKFKSELTLVSPLADRKIIGW
jgi:hypothetical protein